MGLIDIDGIFKWLKFKFSTFLNHTAPYQQLSITPSAEVTPEETPEETPDVAQEVAPEVALEPEVAAVEESIPEPPTEETVDSVTSEQTLSVETEVVTKETEVVVATETVESTPKGMSNSSSPGLFRNFFLCCSTISIIEKIFSILSSLNL